MSFELLSEPIRRYIRDKRWEELRPIQHAAITRILSSDENYILASRTASGKTEAAFLPVLSKVNFSTPGVQVLYISPLIALINDQFQRVEELCKYLDVPVTKWHGEASRSAKEQLLKQPSGIVLITPESIEAMFVNKPSQLRFLFSNLRYVIIDEIHSFIGTDRGIQLQSLLSRLQLVNDRMVNVIGLSATIGDYEAAKQFTGKPEQTRVLLDRSGKEVEARFKYFESTAESLPPDLLKDLYMETCDRKALIFPNSRGRAEEVAVKLQKIAQRVKGHTNYFSHHSSVHKEVREYVEHFAKNNRRENFCIACTSTLELGIDIGTVDEVVQVDAAHSIASLVQRVGRSGRRDGEKSRLCLYATSPWSLLQSLACWQLYKEGFIEPPMLRQKPYDIFLHQLLSVVKGHSGIRQAILLKQLSENFAFRQISTVESEHIITYLLQTGMLEKIGPELIIGVDGEKVVNSREFYSVFKTEPQFKVIHSGNAIGEIPLSPQIREDENLLLAARIWKIRTIDFSSKKIEVTPANDGKPPVFYGGGAEVHLRIREKMLELLFSKEEPAELDENSRNALRELRKEFAIFSLQDAVNERPVLLKESKVLLYPFTGTRISRTLQYLMDLSGMPVLPDHDPVCFEIEIPGAEAIEQFSYLSEQIPFAMEQLPALLENKPVLLDFSKWGQYLPPDYQVSLLKERWFDFEEVKVYLEKIKWIKNS